ncbi:MAG: glycosyltransferase family A protein [Pseudomonadota bacterium]
MIGAVVIGRNEGERLVRCLASLSGISNVVYVDSGSTDGSIAAAQGAGADVVALDMNEPFTAARARNAGLARLREGGTPPEFVQFVDGDCAVQPGWVETAHAFLRDHPKAAVACGRRRERYPDASTYNRLCDLEWDTPVGLARACGGDALMRMAALDEVGDYNPTLIAGEEPELCVRLRKSGWEIWRLEAEMTLHDAAMTRFGQWWIRSRRAGHAFAEGAAMHGGPPERHGVVETRRALLWGLGLPVVTVLAAAITPWGWLLLLAYPLQILRLGLRSGDWVQAFFLTIGKFAEMLGILGYWLGRLRRHQARLIEYK